MPRQVIYNFKAALIFILMWIVLCPETGYTQEMLRPPTGTKLTFERMEDGWVKVKGPRGDFDIVALDSTNRAAYVREILELVRRDKIFSADTYIRHALSSLDEAFSYVARIDTEVVGFIICGRKSEQNGKNNLYLYSIGVANNNREAAIGSALLLFAAKSAEERDIAFMSTDVWREDRELLNFFRRRGFTIDPTWAKERGVLHLYAETRRAIEWIQGRMERPMPKPDKRFSLYRSAL